MIGHLRRHDIWISKNLKYDLSQERKELSKWNKKTFSPVSQVLSFRHTKQTSKNVPDTAFKHAQVYLTTFTWIIKMHLYMPKHMQNQIYPQVRFWDIAVFNNFGYTWPNTLEITEQICNLYESLITCKKTQNF